MRTNLYFVGDGLWSGSGFGEQLRNLSYRLAQSGEYEIFYQSLQHLGYPIDVPDTMFPDLPHKGVTIKVLANAPTLPTEYGSYIFPFHYYKYNPDLLYFMGDPKNAMPWKKVKQDIPIPFIFYTTLDGLPIRPRWLGYFECVDALFGMTEWATYEYMKAGVPIRGWIHHGINWSYWDTNEAEKYRIRRRYNISDDDVIFIS